MLCKITFAKNVGKFRGITLFRTPVTVRKGAECLRLYTESGPCITGILHRISPKFLKAAMFKGKCKRL